MRYRTLKAGLMAGAVATSLVAVNPAAAQSASVCEAAPRPVMTLDFGSRYTGESNTRSNIDEDANAHVDAELGPVDDFLRDLTDMANDAIRPGGDRALADCVLRQIESWARVNALADLQGNARLTIGSRLAGFGLVLAQANTVSRDRTAMRTIAPWLEARMQDQMTYWEAEGPKGASRGNLRAWAGLAAASIGTVLDDPMIRGWGAWSATYVMCTAGRDGSIPQEMSRGHLALHYQLHAIAPLTATAALLDRQGIDLAAQCDGALGRIVRFTVNDLSTGAATRAITGETQSFFDGSDEIEGWQLAWLEPYLTIDYDPSLVRLADTYGPLSYSKLGGDQSLLWSQLRW